MLFIGCFVESKILDFEVVQLKGLYKEYPILKEDIYHGKVKKKNKILLIDLILGFFKFVSNLFIR
jgi:hypothetical protein